ncbi:QueT transporter family protein [Bacillus massiliglaciei]|uniref:QueT transporter family protein n=1 Tax=Bacillus massiliglaciei TaxID=1816693 RepID=UPI000B064046|nr:QueT transporter family protein [Bacillus massiliglaciei]
MNTKTAVTNGILAALYIAVSYVIQPIGFSVFQFRVPEIFNHLIVFNKKYIYGIVAGVFISNLLFSPMKAYDLVFGVAHSLLSLLIILFVSKYVKSIKARMAITTVTFTIMIFLVAIELHLAFGLPFWFSWATTAAGEFAVLAIGAPIIYFMNKRIRFDQMLEK